MLQGTIESKICESCPNHAVRACGRADCLKINNPDRLYAMMIDGRCPEDRFTSFKKALCEPL